MPYAIIALSVATAAISLAVCAALFSAAIWTAALFQKERDE